MDNRCRHHRSWLVAGGYIEWCYECGAIRQMKHTGPNTIDSYSTWVKPVGKGGENPYGKMKPLKK